LLQRWFDLYFFLIPPKSLHSFRCSIIVFTTAETKAGVLLIEQFKSLINQQKEGHQGSIFVGRSCNVALVEIPYFIKIYSGLTV